MNRITFFTFLLLFFSQIGISQDFQISTDSKVENSEFIVEGEVVNKLSFYGSEGRIYTKNTILLKKVFKGNSLATETIEVITWGGEVDGIEESWPYLLQLELGDYGVFFLQSANCENCYSVYSSNQGFFRFVEKPVLHATDGYCTYNNIQKDVYNVITNITKRRVDVVKPKTISSKLRNCFNLEVEPIFPTFRESILNLRVLASLSDKPLYLKELEIVVNYDKLNLGANIVSANNIEISYGNELGSNIYSLSIFDKTEDSFSVLISSNEEGLQNLLLDNYKKEIFKLSIVIPEDGLIPDFSISDSQILESTTFIDPSTNFEESIDCIDSNFEFERLCTIEIHNISPKVVAAGVDDESLNGVPGIITITGKGFGEPYSGFIKPNKSDVYFWDIDYNDYFPAAELNYSSWSDTKIVLRVPTVQKRGGKHPNLGAVSHEIKIIRTDCDGTLCEVESKDKLYVRFGMFNDYWEKEYKHIQTSGCVTPIYQNIHAYGGRMRSLVNFNEQGGYNLIIDDMYPEDEAKNIKARNQIIKALDVWRCTYKINVTVVPNEEPYSIDSNTCKIYRSDGLSFNKGVAYMRTRSRSDPCSPDKHIDSAVEHFNIAVNAKVLDGKRLKGLNLFST